MSRTERTSVGMSRVVPIVFVADVDAAVDFYVEKLGFELHYRHDDPACELAIIDRGDVEMHVTNCACEDRRHLGNAFFEVRVDDAPSLYSEYQAAGVAFRWELESRPWGFTDFTVIDPEGNWITFTGPTEGDE